jgi:predicted Zn-dependent protease
MIAKPARHRRKTVSAIAIAVLLPLLAACGGVAEQCATIYGQAQGTAANDACVAQRQKEIEADRIYNARYGGGRNR